MNPIATKLNSCISLENECVFNMLSSFGRSIFFPKGILSQSREAKEKANKFNATVGIATSKGGPLALSSMGNLFPTLDTKDILPYAPVAGKEALRKLWKARLFAKNPSLSKDISTPIVTAGITHGISLFADLFIDKDDTIIIADKFWGTYKLIFEVRRSGNIVNYPLFNNAGRFNIEAFENTLKETAKLKDKLIVLFNFPNNPTGFTPSKGEVLEIKKLIEEQANLGKQVIVLCDDAYFGLFYEEDTIKESVFANFACLNKNILAIKLDGGTKEDYAWGLRVGFITFGLCCQSDDTSQIYLAIEEKVKGAIRSSISNSSHLSQTALLSALKAVGYDEDKLAKFNLMKRRALKLKEVLKDPKYKSSWSVYPFNSGYFMCLLIKDIKAEALRKHLLHRYGTGVIASGTYDIRVAFSCVEEENIQELFDIIYEGVCDLQKSSIIHEDASAL